MRFILTLTFFLISISVNAKTLFFGDSLTYVIGQEYKKKFPDTEIVFNVGFSFRMNHQFMFDTIDDSDLTKYNNIYIVFGTNDFINKADIDNYSILTAIFISRILKNNNNINIVWILPPTLKNKNNNMMVNNTRESIIRALNVTGVSYLDINSIFGVDYKEYLNDRKIRTKDGIHITNYGAKLIIEKLR